MRAHELIQPPDFLSVEEAAAVVRIGRTVAYRLARQYLATNGEEGLPAERFGKQLRVSRVLLERKLGGPITWPIAQHEVVDEPTPAPSTKSRARSRHSRSMTGPHQQPSLPFTE